MSKRARTILIISSVVLSIIGSVALFIWYFTCVVGAYYETTDLNDYGTYVGNFDNDTPTEFITSFFPDAIEPFFENVQYVYHARQGDTFSYEAYLEFSISSETAYNDFVDTVLDRTKLQTFSYDPNYQEYIVNDYFALGSLEYKERNEHEKGYSIEAAEIGKILINDEHNTIIFVALAVYDGGTVKTGQLDAYFTKFQIDPIEYQNGRDKMNMIYIPT